MGASQAFRAGAPPCARVQLHGWALWPLAPRDPPFRPRDPALLARHLHQQHKLQGRSLKGRCVFPIPFVESPHALTISHLRPTDLVSAAVDPTSLEIQQEIAEGWGELIQQRQPELKAEVHILGSVQEAVETVRELKSASEEVEVLVTGSLLLIGGLMEVARFPMEV